MHTPSNLHAHHWCYPKNNTLTDIMSSNGICLCKDCHKKVHRDYDFYRNKISKLKRFVAIPKILEKVIHKPIDFTHARDIISRSRKDLRAIYNTNNYKRDNITSELLRVSATKKLENLSKTKEE